MSKRELIDIRTEKRDVQRDDKDKFKGSVDVRRSLSPDKRHAFTRDTKPCEGDRGDHQSS
jgi:hypothetical protein